MCRQGLTRVPQRADVLAIRASAIRKLKVGGAHEGVSGTCPIQGYVGACADIAMRVCRRVYTLSLGEDHPITQGAAAVLEGSGMPGDAVLASGRRSD